MRKYDYSVYILTNKRISTLHMVITNDILQRDYQER